MTAVHARDLADALANVAPHADAGNEALALAHLGLTATHLGLTVTATDRYTLAEQTVPRAEDTEPTVKAGRVMVHVGGVREMVKLLDGWSGGKPEPTVEVDLTAGSITTDREWVLAGDQSCTFPPYASLWPDGPCTTGHPAWAVSPALFARYTRLRLFGRRPGTKGYFDAVRIDAGPTPTSPMLVTSVALTEAGVDFRSLLMPVRMVS